MKWLISWEILIVVWVLHNMKFIKMEGRLLAEQRRLGNSVSDKSNLKDIPQNN